MSADELQQIAELEKRLIVTPWDLDNTIRVLDNAKGNASFKARRHRQAFKLSGYAIDWDNNEYYRAQEKKIQDVIDIITDQFKEQN